MKKIIFYLFLIVSINLLFLSVNAANSCSELSTTKCDLCITEPSTFSGYNLIYQNCENGICNFSLSGISGIGAIDINTSLKFKNNNLCGDNNINVNVYKNMNYFIESTGIEQSISFYNSSGNKKDFNLTFKNSTLNLYVYSENKPISDLNFSVYGNLIFNGGASLLVHQQEKAFCDSVIGDIYFNFNNIYVNKDASTNFSISSADTFDGCLESIVPGKVLFIGKNIINYSSDFNLEINAGNSGNALSIPGDGGQVGGKSISGGNVYFKVSENIFNYGKLNIDINGGYGGDGGKGQNRDKDETASPGYGGNAGKGGDVYFIVNNINNLGQNSSLVINLVAGKGGNGGNTGFDAGAVSGRADYAEGGNGGDGGNIYLGAIGTPLNDIDLIYNEGNYSFIMTTGSGGNGGAKINHGCINNPNEGQKGKDGSPGSGGFLIGAYKKNPNNMHESFKIGVNTIYNNSNDFNLSLITGSKGNFKNPNTPEFPNCPLGNPNDGHQGSIYGPLQINYLTNRNSDKLNILLENGKVYNASPCVFINYLRPGSYLPKSIYIVNSDYTHNRGGGQDLNYVPDSNIDISGCFAGIDSNAKYDYISQNINLYLNNLKDVILNIDYSKIFNINYGLAKDSLKCNYCDYSEFGSRLFDTYSIYSSVSGTILPRDLQIYYSNNVSKKYLDNPIFISSPIYKNQNAITGAYDAKYGLYKYEILANNLVWYDSIDYIEKMYPTNDPFCQAQEYYVSGKIGSTSFEFPFTPIFKK